MTTEIEKKFFETFGTGKICTYQIDYNPCVYKTNHIGCKHCQIDKDYYWKYPPITAEKVLRLEEIILNKYENIQLNKAQDDYPYQYETKDLFTDWHKTKVEAISALLFGIYNDLTPQERNEVKEVLEG